jgi:hypothetical protein
MLGHVDAVELEDDGTVRIANLTRRLAEGDAEYGDWPSLV